MKKIMFPLVAALALAGCCGLKAPKTCPRGDLVGNWGLKLPFAEMSAGHLIVEKAADGSLSGFMLWRWGSPVTTKYVKIGENGDFELQHAWGPVVRGRVIGCTIVAKAYENDGKEIGDVVGWRNKPICPKVSTKDAKLGAPIDLLKDGLDGWSSMNEKAPFGWSMKTENGEKVLSNVLPVNEKGEKIHGANIMSKRTDFFDFNLSYDVRVPKGSNSGVYLRSRYEIQTFDSYGKPLDCHNMAAYYGRVTPSVAAEKPAGEWQHVDVTLYKKHLTVVLNGSTIIDNAPVTGITGGAVDANEDIPGPMYIQGDHSDADYKNMILRPVVD